MDVSKIPIFEIRSKLRQELKDIGMAESTKLDYLASANNLIRFMENQNFTEYSKEVGDVFFRLTRNESSLSASARARLHKLVRVLDYIIGAEKSPLLRQPFRESYDIPEVYKPLVDNFYDTYREIGRSDATLSQYMYSLSRFTVGMWLKKIGPESITRDSITDFFTTRPENVQTPMVVAVKYFCRYLFHEGIINDELANFFSRFHKKPTRKLLSHYTPEEIVKIESMLDRTTEIGKRDYAMILLSSRYGLRSSDIRNLKFNNIDWESNKIKIIQLKTHQELELPLLADVGEAIIDYIKNGRPRSKFSTIFVTHQYPFETIPSAQFYRMVRTTILKADLGDGNGKRKKGPHSMRHSLATALMNNGEQLSTISQILGHKSCETTKVYLTVNIQSLLQCSLAVPAIDDAFYMQEGGVFYDKS